MALFKLSGVASKDDALTLGPVNAEHLRLEPFHPSHTLGAIIVVGMVSWKRISCLVTSVEEFICRNLHLLIFNAHGLKDATETVELCK
jgi:hypothetical protein